MREVRRRARCGARRRRRARRRPPAAPGPSHRQGRHRSRPHVAHDRLRGDARGDRRGDPQAPAHRAGRGVHDRRDLPGGARRGDRIRRRHGVRGAAGDHGAHGCGIPRRRARSPRADRADTGRLAADHSDRRHLGGSRCRGDRADARRRRRHGRRHAGPGGGRTSARGAPRDASGHGTPRHDPHRRRLGAPQRPPGDVRRDRPRRARVRTAHPHRRPRRRRQPASELRVRRLPRRVGRRRGAPGRVARGRRALPRRARPRRHPHR